MNLDDLLHDVLNDDHWALPVAPDALERIRRGRRARRRRTVALTAAGCLAVAGGGALVAAALPGNQARLSTYAAGGAPDGQPVPGITPPFTPTSGRDWLLTRAQAQAWDQTHTRPSPGPGQSVVASPAPLGRQSADLLAGVQAAGLPAGTTMTREDSVGGQPGAAAVHLRLAGGIPVEVQAGTLQEPFGYEDLNGENQNPGATVADVPGTTSAAAVYPTYGYGFAGYPSPTAHAVFVVTRGGYETEWVAPATVSLDDLRTWAFAAAQH